MSNNYPPYLHPDKVAFYETTRSDLEIVFDGLVENGRFISSRESYDSERRVNVCTVFVEHEGNYFTIEALEDNGEAVIDSISKGRKA